MKADKMRRSREKRIGSVMQSRYVAAEVQSLESRALPTGTVTASLSNGNLTIGGDNLDNSILIEVRTTGIFLTGVQDTDSDPATFTKVRFGGETFEAGEEVLLTESLTIKSLTISMRGGNDKVRLEVGVAATDPEPNAPEVSVTGRLRINLGRGDDHSVLLLNNGALTIGGNLEGDLDNGNDCFLVGTLEELNAGVDPQDPIQVNGGVIILGRLGTDLIGLADIDVARSMNVNGGVHDDTLSLQAATIGGTLVLDGHSGDDDIHVEEVTTVGATVLRGGSGNDRLRITSLDATGNVTVHLAAGEDQCSIGAVTLGDATKVTLNGGAGTDALASDSVLTDPPFKVRGFEDTEAIIDAQAIIDTIAGLISDCLADTAPTP
jgi:hypothetical protein